MTNEQMLEAIYNELGDVESVDRALAKKTKGVSLDHVVKRFHTWTKFTKEYLAYCIAKRNEAVKVTTKTVRNKDGTKKTV